VEAGEATREEETEEAAHDEEGACEKKVEEGLPGGHVHDPSRDRAVVCKSIAA
jgi:hypothetical protein